MKLHHIGIASNNIQEAIERHKALFGLRQVTSVVKDPIHKVSAVLLPILEEYLLRLLLL